LDLKIIAFDGTTFEEGYTLFGIALRPLGAEQKSKNKKDR